MLSEYDSDAITSELIIIDPILFEMNIVFRLGMSEKMSKKRTGQIIKTCARFSKRFKERDFRATKWHNNYNKSLEGENNFLFYLSIKVLSFALLNQGILFNMKSTLRYFIELVLYVRATNLKV